MLKKYLFIVSLLSFIMLTLSYKNYKHLSNSKKNLFISTPPFSFQYPLLLDELHQISSPNKNKPLYAIDSSLYQLIVYLQNAEKNNALKINSLRTQDSQINTKLQEKYKKFNFSNKVSYLPITFHLQYQKYKTLKDLIHHLHSLPLIITHIKISPSKQLKIEGNLLGRNS